MSMLWLWAPVRRRCWGASRGRLSRDMAAVELPMLLLAGQTHSSGLHSG